MTTVTVQIEAVLNSRPLCPLSEDATDYSALTPGHFLMGQAPTTIPEPNLSAIPISRLTRWQHLRQTVEHFWKRWSAECLQRYQAISKWHHPANEIKEGSLVLITDERYPPRKVAPRQSPAATSRTRWLNQSRHPEDLNVHIQTTYCEVMHPTLRS
ncbi:hypothetical protein RF55_18460 [Lasius niger]|uniref:DUF5641 domain-containing protein n=1 Tax=Lasius niger TaxID=67767 RepID=A0A0J7K1A5_LASNI|nr:hypothetical protein RF55_18460 [Lasius niger]